MKRNKILIPFALVVVLFLSYYMLYSERIEVKNEYENYLEQARAYAEQGIAVDAVQNYMYALEVKDTLEINKEVGELFLSVEDITGAIDWSEQMVEKYPEDPEAYAFLLNIYRNTTLYDEFFALYDVVEKRDIVTEEIAAIMDEIEYSYYLDEDFEAVGVYSNGYCAVQKDGKWGMVNETGSRVVPYKYASIGAFMSDVAPVKTEDGKVFYIDAEGNKKKVVQGVDNIVELSPLLNDLFSVYDGESWTYYTIEDKKIGESYDAVSVTGNYLAAVESNGYFYIVDTDIKKINDEKYMDVISDDKGIVYRNDVLFVNKDGSYYMINSEGKKIGDGQYEDAKLFNDNTYAAVKGSKGWYFIDNTGKSIFKDLYFQDARSFSNGYAAVKQNGRWGFIDMEGNIVIDCIFEDAKDFNTKGCVFVQQEDIWQLLKLYSMNYDA